MLYLRNYLSDEAVYLRVGGLKLKGKEEILSKIRDEPRVETPIKMTKSEQIGSVL